MKIELGRQGAWPFTRPILWNPMHGHLLVIESGDYGPGEMFAERLAVDLVAREHDVRLITQDDPVLDALMDVNELIRRRAGFGEEGVHQPLIVILPQLHDILAYGRHPHQMVAKQLARILLTGRAVNVHVLAVARQTHFPKLIISQFASWVILGRFEDQWAAMHLTQSLGLVQVPHSYPWFSLDFGPVTGKVRWR